MFQLHIYSAQAPVLQGELVEPVHPLYIKFSPVSELCFFKPAQSDCALFPGSLFLHGTAQRSAARRCSGTGTGGSGCSLHAPRMAGLARPLVFVSVSFSYRWCLVLHAGRGWPTLGSPDTPNCTMALSTAACQPARDATFCGRAARLSFGRVVR